MDWFLYDNGLRHGRVTMELIVKIAKGQIFLQKAPS